MASVNQYDFHVSMPSSFGATSADKFARHEQVALELGSRADATSIGMDTTVFGDIIVSSSNLVWFFILGSLRGVGYTYAQVITILGLSEVWVQGTAVFCNGASLG